MGGTALSKYGVITRRVDTEEFYKIAHKIQNQINKDFGNDITMFVAPFYKSKPDHGDLDLLVCFNNNIADFKQYINYTFKPKAIHLNGGVYSFDYINLQIDIIPVSHDNWKTAKTYFSYDPLPNIQGKVFHKFGLSYGWDGLSYKFRNFNGSLSQKIIISKDIKKIFEFAEYDYDKYLEGFETLDEIFDYIIDNKYFDHNIFQLKNLGRIDRKRNLRRKSYNAFIKYISDNNITKEYSHKSKEEYLIDIDNYFPEAELIKKLDNLEKIDITNKFISNKFNGNIVMSWIKGLEGKELGGIIHRFREELDENYNEFIINSSHEQIKDKFLNIYNIYKE